MIKIFSFRLHIYFLGWRDLSGGQLNLLMLTGNKEITSIPSLSFFILMALSIIYMQTLHLSFSLQLDNFVAIAIFA